VDSILSSYRLVNRLSFTAHFGFCRLLRRVYAALCLAMPVTLAKTLEPGNSHRARIPAR
jgi:hypothetical protein